MHTKYSVIAYSICCSQSCVSISHLYGHQSASSHNLSPTFVMNSRSTWHKSHHSAFTAVYSPQHHYAQHHTCILTTYPFYHAYPSPPTVRTSCYHCLPTITSIHIITTHHFNMQIQHYHQFVITHQQEFILSSYRE